MTTRRPVPNFDFARAYAAGPMAPRILFSADESADDEPDRYDWSDDEDEAGEADDDSGQWESDVEQLAALAVTRASHSRHVIGSTLARTLERWR
jgi:hypothetical protein